MKAFEDFKDKQQKSMNHEVMFFNMQKYVYSESVFNTLCIQIKHKSQKNSLQTK